MTSPPTPIFLNWVADRLVSVYGESPNVDFVNRLRHEAARAATLMLNLSENEETYQLFDTGEVSMAGHHAYMLQRRGKPGKLGAKFWLSQQEFDDLSRQLDAGVDYFND